MVTKTKLPLPTEKQTTAWAKYDAMESGLRNYWYPVLLTKSVGSKPISIKLFDEQIMFIRDPASGKVFAVRDRCLHRGTLSRLGCRTFLEHSHAFITGGAMTWPPANYGRHSQTGPSVELPGK